MSTSIDTLYKGGCATNNKQISKPLAKKIYNSGGNIYKLDSNNNVLSKYYSKGENNFQWGNVSNFNLADIMK